MPREFSRGRRVADHIQKELAVLIQQEVKDPRLGLITINEVKVSRDLGFADVYFTSFTRILFVPMKALERTLKLKVKIVFPLQKCLKMLPVFFALV